MWSISVDGEVYLQHDVERQVAGPGASGLFGMTLFCDVIQITPVGPFVRLPPKNEVEWFAVAFHYISGIVDSRARLSYETPPGYEKWIRPGGPDAVY